MLCPYCGSPTTVGRTRQARGGVEVRRERICSGTEAHRFNTAEHRDFPGLAGVGVRHSGDGRLSEGAFNWDRFVRDVKVATWKALSDQETESVCLSVKQSLEQNLPTLMNTLRPGEAKRRPDLRGWIPDTAITTAVEAELRVRRPRVAQALYALSIRGRSDSRGRTGWAGSRDFLSWLFDNYPDLECPIPKSPEIATDRWYPSRLAIPPQQVIKKTPAVLAYSETHGKPLQLTRQRVLKPFNRPQFTASIATSLSGRPDQEYTARMVTEWVLWGIYGQSEVHSGQLGVGVMNCLRRVDDIAYLRWAAISKGMVTITEIRDEALALVEHPSSKLIFDRQLRPRRPDSGRPTFQEHAIGGSGG